MEKIQTTASLAHSMIERGNRKIIFQIGGKKVGNVEWINLNNETLFVKYNGNKSGAIYNLEYGEIYLCVPTGAKTI